MTEQRKLTPHDDKEIYTFFESNWDGTNKSEVARMYGVSPRTIGRAIERHEKTLSDPVAVDENASEEVSTPVVSAQKNKGTGSHQCMISPNSFIQIFKMVDGVAVDQNTILASNPLFQDTFDHIMQNSMSEDSLKVAWNIASVDTALEVYSEGKVKADPNTGRVTYTDDSGMEREIPQELNDRIITMIKEGEKGVSGLVKFTDMLMENPSRNSVMELYKFMENNCIGIDENGFIVAYKGVNERLYDCHSNTFNNAPGNTPTVPRNMVDDDARNECSYGLHVGALEYASNFGSRTLRVRVNPKDVVACTADHSFQKMRCCSYYVIEEI